MELLWQEVTLAQALILIAALWVITRGGEVLYSLIRARRGLPALVPFEHCEHCALVDEIGEHLERLVALGTDQCGLIEELTAHAGRTADDVAAVHGRVDDLVAAVSAAQLSPAGASLRTSG